MLLDITVTKVNFCSNVPKNYFYEFNKNQIISSRMSQVVYNVQSRDLFVGYNYVHYVLYFKAAV